MANRRKYSDAQPSNGVNICMVFFPVMSDSTWYMVSQLKTDVLLLLLLLLVSIGYTYSLDYTL